MKEEINYCFLQVKWMNLLNPHEGCLAYLSWQIYADNSYKWEAEYYGEYSGFSGTGILEDHIMKRLQNLTKLEWKERLSKLSRYVSSYVLEEDSAEEWEFTAFDSSGSEIKSEWVGEGEELHRNLRDIVYLLLNNAMHDIPMNICSGNTNTIWDDEDFAFLRTRKPYILKGSLASVIKDIPMNLLVLVIACVLFVPLLVMHTLTRIFHKQWK